MGAPKFEGRLPEISGSGLSIPPIESSDDFRARLAVPAGFRASPFSWVDPKKIPRRRWLYGRHYIRKFITETVAPGA
jgi:hypothetical protein